MSVHQAFVDKDELHSFTRSTRSFDQYERMMEFVRDVDGMRSMFLT